MKKTTHTNPMGYEDVPTLLAKMSLPIMLSMLIQSLYNITDSYFVSQYSEKALRATSISFPIQILIIALGVGTGVGINSYISRNLGAGNEEEADQGAMHGLLLVFVSWILFIIFRLTMIGPFLSRFTEDPVVMEMGMEYLGLITSFSFLAITQITIEKIIQGTGNMVRSMLIQLLGAIVNIILDPILIFGLLGFPSMGIKGAAIATVIGQGSGALLGMYFLLSNKISLNIDYKKFKPSLETIKNIYAVGFPSILMQSVRAFLTTVLNVIVAQNSELAVSVLGIYFKLESFVFMPVLGLSQGVLPIIGYNYGAKNKERIDEVFKYGVRAAFGMMLMGTVLFQIFPAQLMSIFTEDQTMIEMGTYTLRIISTSYVFAGIGIINSVFFQAIGLGKFSLLVTTLRQIVIIIPMAYFLSKIGLNATWLAYPIAEIAAVITSVYLKNKAQKTYIDVL